MSTSRKSIALATFIGLTFIGTFTIQLWLISQGIRFDTDVVRYTPLGWLFLTMWMPALAALFSAKWIEGRSWSETKESLSLRMGSFGPYLLTFFLAPAAFAAIYGLTWAFGLSTPDWNMTALTQATGSEPITKDEVLQLMLPLSVFIGPLMHFPFALGEEIGWRGFLLPRLMPMGKPAAYIIVGILWGLWHAPVIWVGFNYPDNPVAGIAMMCLLTTAFGLFLNEMTLHYQSTYLAAFIHGAVNAQGFGIWMWLFPSTDPILGGGTGFSAVMIWVVLGALAGTVLARLRRSE
ncbi:CPBP family intramembrane glutamic endopeptidase [Pseudodesulfovibrio sp. zrk46]|uniref:CPBP family intramembrane glutamic endopeptidase n=1 Tax=Pseudodesulfovibrio sp. zrk46 TaxID=2725288 RepID=UPI0014492161|nr:CPBP family intramembrane glutamic endopeptidase [Pseudodesulfovibrio sp. zrk46]QJB58269.1 CPBP family intramembrane metalloprotease [Pseudodesulfovibrio sp. zrk46]